MAFILLIPFFGTALGSAMVFLLKSSMPQRLEKFLIGFAAGVMTTASLWSLLIPSLEMSRNDTLPWFRPALGFLAGMFFLLLLDSVIPHLHLYAEKPEEISSTLMLVAADRLVRKAISSIGSGDYDPRNGDVVWCVFDRDENTDEMLEKARKIADEVYLNIAFSNPSFELWFLLHFCQQTAELRDCSDVIHHLRSKGRIENYEKNRDYFDFLLPYMDKAVERAEKG